MPQEKSFSWKRKDGSRIRVSVEPSYAWRNVCRFVVAPPVYPDGALHLSVSRNLEFSPLAREILDVEGVAEVLIAGDSVTVTTAQPADWDVLGENIAAAIREQMETGVPPVAPEHSKTLPPAEEIRKKVQNLIETVIEPAVASHGGTVTLLDVRGNNVYLEFGGGCQGCGMAHVTLKHGVERLLREHVPEVGMILDTTDHAGGRNPYYSPHAR
jgi:Fe-S cluster biogenesis protein NfuA